MIRYGDLLKACRTIRGMTQQELSKATYITQAQISSYESGKVAPRIDVFDDLIEACGYELGLREKKHEYTAEEMTEIIERVNG